MKLRIRYDDGFIAHLNGMEIARRNAPPAAGWNSAAVTERPGGAALVAEEIDVSSFASLLRAGANVLAVQGLNFSAADPECLSSPELFAGTSLPTRIFPSPTPGAANEARVGGFVGDTHFSVRRGFHDAPFSVTISCATPGATIAFTTDGSRPSAAHGTHGASPGCRADNHDDAVAGDGVSAGVRPRSLERRYADFPVCRSCGRTATPASRAGDASPAAHPPILRWTRASRAPIRPRIRAARFAAVDSDARADAPDRGYLWGSAASTSTPPVAAEAYERAASAEWLDPSGSEGFHVNCGLRIHGNISRDKGFTPKHSFKMFFRSDYGETKLQHAIFPASPVESFDELILRAGSTDTWAVHRVGTDRARPERRAIPALGAAVGQLRARPMGARRADRHGSAGVPRPVLPPLSQRHLLGTLQHLRTPRRRLCLRPTSAGKTRMGHAGGFRRTAGRDDGGMESAHSRRVGRAWAVSRHYHRMSGNNPRRHAQSGLSGVAQSRLASSIT